MVHCDVAQRPLPQDRVSAAAMSWTEAKTRAIVKERCMGHCERCAARGAEMHHRKNRSQGGEWSPSNIVCLCSKCHNWVGANPIAAHEVGLHVRPWEDPEDSPIKTGNVPFLLDNDGCFTTLHDDDVLTLPLPGWAR